MKTLSPHRRSWRALLAALVIIHLIAPLSFAQTPAAKTAPALSAAEREAASHIKTETIRDVTVGLTAKDIDVIVAYIVSRDIWYVVPVKAFVPRKNLWFYPDGSKKGAMFEKYRDAWWVMTRRKRR